MPTMSVFKFRLRTASLARWALVLGAYCAAACVNHGVPPQPPRVPGSQLVISDDALSEAVARELRAEPAVPPNSVFPTIHSGVVTLSGTVDNLLARGQAERRVRAVRSVRSVVNLIQVIPSSTRPDAALEQDVRAALQGDEVTATEQIEAHVVAGVAVLKGHVDSHGEVELAELIASAVTGLRSVQNELTVRSQGPRDDSDIRAEIEARLRWDALANVGLVRVRVLDGAVAVSGTVGSAAARERVARDAWVPGVRSVSTEGVEVAWWARDPNSRAEAAQRTDSQLAAAVKAALLHDPRTASHQVEVQASSGTVFLRGDVGSLAAKRAAEKDAEATVGVAAVRNELVVRSTHENADATSTRLSQALSRHPYLRDSMVTVAVADGVVSLRGLVASNFERAIAEQVAARDIGVREVRNELRVRDDSPLTVYDPYGFETYPTDLPQFAHPVDQQRSLSDGQIAERVRGELMWSPVLDASQIDVSVQSGTATLVGSVSSRAEMLAATVNAMQAGALRVDNRLTVR